MADVRLTGLPLDYPNSGSAVYTRNLLRRLPEEMPDHTLGVYQRWSIEQFHGVQSTRLTSPFARWNRGRGVGARFDKLGWEIAAVPLAAAASGVSLLHFTYFAAPIRAPCPVVITVHDVIPLVVRGYHRSRQSAWYSRFMARNARRAVRIITVSYNSQRDITQALGIPPSHIDVIYEAADERFHPRIDGQEESTVREKLGLPERFVLYTGGAERRKNIVTLIRAWAEVKERLRERHVRLVVISDIPAPDALYPDVRRLVRELELEQDVFLLSSVADSELPALYRAAELYCFPSTYEGFGLTPLEAMASGVPVISSNSSSLPEVIGDAGILLSADDVHAWGDAILQVLDSSSLRRELAERGVRRAGNFSWRQTALQTAAVYRRALAL